MLDMSTTNGNVMRPHKDGSALEAILQRTLSDWYAHGFTLSQPAVPHLNFRRRHDLLLSTDAFLIIRNRVSIKTTRIPSGRLVRLGTNVIVPRRRCSTSWSNAIGRPPLDNLSTRLKFVIKEQYFRYNSVTSISYSQSKRW